MEHGLYGVLLDVSGSMRSAYSLDTSHTITVERIHAIFTTIMNIVKRETVHHERRDKIFACAFGLNQGSGICDLLSLLEFLRHPKSEFLRNYPESDGYKALMTLAKESGVAHSIIPWFKEIREVISPDEAQLLCAVLRTEPGLMYKIVNLIPPASIRDTYMRRARIADSCISLVTLGRFGKFEARTRAAVNRRVEESEAVRLTKEIIREYYDVFDGVSKYINDQLIPRSVQYVSEMLDHVLPERSTTHSMHANIGNSIKVFKSIIFGSTPMCKALEEALATFSICSERQKRILFIISDGISTDGCPSSFAKTLRSAGVVIATCFLTSDRLFSPKKLYDKENFPFHDGRRVLFEMSSVVENIQPPISYLVDANWELSPSGESCLFFQANSLDVVNEFCNTVISQMMMSCDALVKLIGKVDLATLINQENAQFQPQKQIGGTCYANAIAAVFYLAMHRIVGREGGYPNFKEIRQHIIHEYGKNGANTKTVLNNVCSKYRLHFTEVDVYGARQAINKRRPVVARFYLYGEEWQKFSEFYRKYPKETLKKCYLAGRACDEANGGGHAVVLIRCSPTSLTFMNSWGTQFGNGGFFSVEDESVLRDMKFYDVYWFETDLYESEKKAFEVQYSKKCRDLAEKFPSIMELPFVCPKCNEMSKIGSFSGHVLQAKCPKCSKTFTPTNEQLMQSLYIQAHKPTRSFMPH